MLAVWTRVSRTYYGEPIELPVLVGILPLQSTSHAEFLHNEVPGITLDRPRASGCGKPEPNGRRKAWRWRRNLLAALKPHAQGVYIMPSFGRYEVAADVLEGLN